MSNQSARAPSAGDLLHHVAQGIQLPHVDCGDHVDPDLQQFLRVLPPCCVTRTGRGGVREPFKQRDLGPAGQHRAQIQLFEHRAAERHLGGRPELEAGQESGGRLAVRGRAGHDDVGAAFRAPVTLPEHGAGRANPRPRAEENPQPSAGAHCWHELFSSVGQAQDLPYSCCDPAGMWVAEALVEGQPTDHGIGAVGSCSIRSNRGIRLRTVRCPGCPP
jgi:hypothetical protein